MVSQFLNPGGQPFAATIPYHYVCGNHDVRGPGVRQLARSTDVPGDYFYSFRRGPLGVLVRDTGVDKPDDHPVYGGIKRKRLPQFEDAKFKILFCHITLCWLRLKESGTYCVDGQKKRHELLEKAGVQLVISGYTHEPAWMPAEKGRSYGQLIGGGPKPDAATYIRGHATTDGLTVTQYRLNGEVQHTIKVT